MDLSIKTLIIKAIDEEYIEEFHNQYTEYLGVLAKRILEYLLKCYGKITPLDMKHCRMQMKDPINITKPISLYYQKIDDAIKLMADADKPFSNEQS